MVTLSLCCCWSVFHWSPISQIGHQHPKAVTNTLRQFSSPTSVTTIDVASKNLLSLAFPTCSDHLLFQYRIKWGCFRCFYLWLCKMLGLSEIGHSVLLPKSSFFQFQKLCGFKKHEKVFITHFDLVLSGNDGWKISWNFSCQGMNLSNKVHDQWLKALCYINYVAYYMPHISCQIQLID